VHPGLITNTVHRSSMWKSNQSGVGYRCFFLNINQAIRPWYFVPSTQLVSLQDVKLLLHYISFGPNCEFIAEASFNNKADIMYLQFYKSALLKEILFSKSLQTFSTILSNTTVISCISYITNSHNLHTHTQVFHTAPRSEETFWHNILRFPLWMIKPIIKVQ
jgi:hypothetical protein